MIGPRLSWVSSFLLGLVVVAAVMATGSLWVWQHAIGDQLEALRNERFRFSVMNLKSALEAGLRLGNSTADLSGTQSLLAQVRDRQPDILSIDVYDAQGEVLFSTDPRGPGLKLPAAWAAPCLSPEGPGWTGADADGGVQCVGLVNAFGQAAGGVLLRHRSHETGTGLDLPSDWPWLTALTLALMIAATWGSALAVGPLHRLTHDLRQRIERQDAEPEPDDLHGDDHPFGPARAALQALQAHDRWLVDADAEADQLDRQEME